MAGKRIWIPAFRGDTRGMSTVVSCPGPGENPEYLDEMGSNICTHTGAMKLPRSTSEADPEI